MDGPGGLPHGVLDGGYVGAGHGLGHRQHPVQHVLEVHRRGAGGVEIVPVLPALGHKGAHLGLPALESQDVEGIPGKDANGRGPPHPEGGDGLVEFLRGGELQVDRLVGQAALVQDADGTAVNGEADVVRVGNLFQIHPWFTSFFTISPIVTRTWGKSNAQARGCPKTAEKKRTKSDKSRKMPLVQNDEVKKGGSSVKNSKKNGRKRAKKFVPRNKNQEKSKETKRRGKNAVKNA